MRRWNVAFVILAAPALSAQHWLDGPLRPAHLGPFVAHGDVDGDGDEDLQSTLDTQVYPQRNDGAAVFSADPPLVLGPEENGSSALLHDLDGDLVLDLITTTHPSGPLHGVTVRPGVGDGTFAAPHFVATPSPPHRVAPGQADGDAESELAVRCLGLSPAIQATLFWIDASAGAPVAWPAYPTSAPSTGDLAALDTDGDGLEEMLASVGQTIAMFSTQPGAAPVLVGTLGMPFPAYPLELLEGDLDGDGDEDVLVASPLADAFEVLENVGAGQLVAGPAQGADLPQGLRLGDWDGDGDLDVVAMDTWMMVSIENLGGLGFAGASSAEGIDTSVRGLADFDADGHLDALTNHHVAFGDGAFGSVYSDKLAFPPTPVSNDDLPLDDVDLDGDLDLPIDATRLVNDGTGALHAELVWPPPPVGSSYGGAAAYGDFDGDGRDDYLTAGALAMRLLSDDGLGGFVDAGDATPVGVKIGSPTSDWPLPTADVDHNGALDVLDQGLAWLNHGMGFFTTTLALPVGEFAQPLDLDRDGDDDLVSLIVGMPAALRVSHQVAPGVFQTADLSLPTYPLSQLSKPRILDLDGDGILDVAVPDQPGVLSQLSLYRGDGTTLLGPYGPLASGGGAGSVAADDVNGDGVLDLIAGRYSVSVHVGLGPPLAYGPPTIYDGSSPIHAMADFDDDGDVDVLSQYAGLEGHRFHGPAAGAIQQYGEGTPGSLGAVPVLGASGPVRPGSGAALHLALAYGGTPTLLVLSTGPASLPGFPLGGLTGLVDPSGLLTILSLPAGGAGPGAGAWTLPVPDPIVAALAGQSLYHQVFAFDPGSPAGLSQTNGLAILYGL